jgi:hypothetical protein
MLDHAKSSNGFWVEAMAIACFIQNKIFTSTLKDITPYEAWYGVKLDVKVISTFLIVWHMFIFLLNSIIN